MTNGNKYNANKHDRATVHLLVQRSPSTAKQIWYQDRTASHDTPVLLVSDVGRVSGSVPGQFVLKSPLRLTEDREMCMI